MHEMFIATLVIRARKRRQSKCPPTDDCISKLANPCNGRMAIKRNEILPRSTTWTDLENVMPSGRSQTQKATYLGFYMECQESAYPQTHSR